MVQPRLGTAEIVGGGPPARTLGLPRQTTLLRLYGLREIGHAGLIFGSATPGQGVWSRVVGDVMDLGTLLAALGPGNPRRGRAGVAFGMVTATLVVDILCAVRLGAAGSGEQEHR